MTAPTEAVETVAESTESVVEVVADTGEMRVRFPVLAVEDLDTSDGRYLTPGEILSRAVPMSILAQPFASHGGQEPPYAVVVGRLDTVERVPGPQVISRATGGPFAEGSFVWVGHGSVDPTIDVHGLNIGNLMRRRFLNGVSVDLAGMDVEMVEDGTPDPDNPRRQMIAHRGEIAAATLVPIPAFADAYVELVDDDAEGEFEPVAPEDLPEGLAASAFPAWRSAEVGDYPPNPALTAAGEEHTGGMIALVPANPDELLVDGGLPADELHLTLAYLGEDVTGMDRDSRTRLLDDVRAIAEATPPVEAEVMGHAAFNPTGAHDREPCAVHLVSGPALTDLKAAFAAHDTSEHPVFLPHITAGPGLEPSALNFVGPVLFDRLRVALADEVVDFPLGGQADDPTDDPDAEEAPMPEQDAAVTAAAAAPLPVDDVYLDQILTAAGDDTHRRPPLAWFVDPELTELTPITIDGPRVYGHIGSWDRKHLSFNGQDVRMPRSRCDYREFLRGGVRVDDQGTERVAAVGHLTFDTSHADGTLSAAAAARFYDHTGFSWARVAAGEDAHGVWVAGILRPGITDEQIDTALAHPPSGDWRQVNGSLELVSVLCVSVPGFGVARSRVASGAMQTLVASGGMASRRAAPSLARIEIGGDPVLRMFRADGSEVSFGAQPADLAGSMSRDELVAAVEARLDEKREAGELSAAHAALVSELDDTPAVVAALLAEVDDTPQEMAALLAALDDDEDVSDEDLQQLADLAAEEGLTEDAFISRMPPQLQKSYLTGKVAARIRWNTPGDMTRCMAQAKVHGMGRMGPGACARLHKIATGVWPGDRRNIG